MESYAFKSASGGDYSGHASSAELFRSLKANCQRAQTAVEVDHAIQQVSHFAACRSITSAQADELRDPLYLKMKGGK
jgi:hypothetical protein